MKKQTRSLVDSGVASRVVICAMWREGLAASETLDEQREVIRFRPRWFRWLPGVLGKGLSHLEWMGRIFLAFRKAPITMVNCHSVTMLPLGVLLKLTHGAELVYDTHELETERAGLHGPVKKAMQLLESSLISQASLVLVVSPSIGLWYRKRYGLRNVEVVRNVPMKLSPGTVRSGNPLREKYALNANDRLFLYHGLFVPGRGIPALLSVFSELPTENHLVLMGYGRLEPLVKEYADRFPNIHLHPAVAMEELVETAACADVGLVLIERTCLSYYYCLPNKLFEYVQGGLPIIASDFPDMRNVVEEHGLGWITEPTATAIKKLIVSLTDEAIAAKKAVVADKRVLYSWDDEARNMNEAYRNFVSLPVRGRPVHLLRSQ